MPVNISEVPYLEPNHNTTLSKEEADAVNRRIEVMRKILKTQGSIARYRIELQFDDDKSTWKPSHVLMSFWESGGKLHGGGNTKLYICRAKAQGDERGCGAFIPDFANTGMSLVCAKCGIVWQDSGQVTGELGFYNTMQQLAEYIYHYYRKLDHNCDICLKYSPNDIRNKTVMEQERQRGGELLEKIRSKRIPSVYPLVNIIKDLQGGADIISRFKAFLTA